MLKQQLQADLKEAMKAHQEVVVQTLRMVLAAILTAEVAGKERHELKDEEALKVLSREIKQRQDSVIEYRKGGRENLAVKEEAEMAVLKKYLPAMMSQAEVAILVEKAIKDMGAIAPSDFGKVIKAVMSASGGKADGQLVSKLVKEKLK